MNPLLELQHYGQSIWLDYIRRSLITGGELERIVKDDGLQGVTSNPPIFHKAIAGSSDYDDQLKNLLDGDPQMEARALYKKLAHKDIQMAADVLRPVYKKSYGADGYVCLELPPDLARESEGSIDEARRIWKDVDRPNLMVKVPATREGIPVVEALISEGINVNVTHIFSLDHYEAVARAYLKGVEKCPAPQRVSSVASFFISRVDHIVDNALEEIGMSEAAQLRGKIAIANAKLAYKRFKEIFRGESWEQLRRKGARIQRLQWASTGTKNPAYSDVIYVEELVGPDTINTLSPATLNAFRDHGQAELKLEVAVEEAEQALRRLDLLGVDLKAMTEKLQEEGIDAFADSFSSLLATLDEKRDTILHGLKEHLTLEIGDFKNQVEARLKLWREESFTRRLWAKDPTLWVSESQPEISNRLGWLVLPEMMYERLEDLISFADQVKSQEISHVILLGMGGSSLAPDIFQRTFGNARGYPELIVLDSTHPSAVLSVEERLDLRSTLFLVSSKSGTTLETLSLFRYFWKKVEEVTERPGHHFVAITDPGTSLAQLAKERGFRRLFEASADVGGRYSAFTYFGLVPAVLIGLDVHKMLDRAWIAAENCAFCVSEKSATGIILGAAIGEIAKRRDKLTFMASPAISSFPDWVEQLIAESTGKDGKGILPVVSEPSDSPLEYGHDRFFVFLVLEEEKNPKLDEWGETLRKAGHPVVWLELKDKFDLGREIFAWEVAVACAGSVLGIHPFNQPDVQLAKDFTWRAMEGGRQQVKDEEEGVETLPVSEQKKLERAIKNWVSQAQEGDYVAIQAFLNPTPKTTTALQDIRREFFKRTKLATTLGYGPRFLHSTGQLHKGGRNNGLFIQVIDEPAENLPIPATDYDFNTLIRAQSLGDYQALKQRGRRVLRIDLKGDGEEGLKKLKDLIRNQS